MTVASNVGDGPDSDTLGDIDAENDTVGNGLDVEEVTVELREADADTSMDAVRDAVGRWNVTESDGVEVP